MDARVDPRTDQDLGGAPEGLDALTVATRLQAAGGVGMFVARDYQRAGNFAQAFRFFAGDIEVVEFPAWDCLPYDRLSPTSAVSAERMAALTQLARRDPADSTPLLAAGDYLGVLRRLAQLREPVDAFFDGVMVMADDAAVRGNRLALLRRLADRFAAVAAVEQLSNA